MRTRPHDIDKRVEDFVRDLIGFNAIRHNGEWVLERSAIERNSIELGRLWFEMDNFNYEFLLEAPKNRAVTNALLNYFHGKVDRMEAREDVCEAIDNILFSFYCGEINQYIEEALRNKNEDFMFELGCRKQMCQQTGAIEWV